MPDAGRSSHLDVSDSEKLIDLLRRWEELTDAESSAIDAEAWARVKTVQDAKRCLQGDIREIHDRLMAAGDTADDNQWRALANDLMKREVRNREELARRRSEAEQERHATKRQGNQLNRLHQAYTTDPNRQWSTYT